MLNKGEKILLNILSNNFKKIEKEGKNFLHSDVQNFTHPSEMLTKKFYSSHFLEI